MSKVVGFYQPLETALWMPRPFGPFLDPKTAAAWFDAENAARVSNTVSNGTWWRWLQRAETNFGLRLETTSILTHSGVRPRRVVSEKSLSAVKDIFDEVFGDNRPHHKPHRFTGDELAELHAAAERRNERRSRPVPLVHGLG